MSSRSSIFYNSEIHLFYEHNEEEICLEFNNCECLDLHSKQFVNETYAAYTMSRDDWKVFALALLNNINQVEGDELIKGAIKSIVKEKRGKK